MLVQYSEVKRARHALRLLLALAFFVTSTSCKSVNTENNPNGSSPDAANNVSSTPPFSTSEPERYQATRVTTSALSDPAQAIAGSPNLTNSQVLIARDGNRRREDYGLDSGETVSYLQLPIGTFLIYHSRKSYAEIMPETDVDAEAFSESIPSEFSPDKLLNESRTESRYEKIGVEEVNGRKTMKYRVTVMSRAGEDKAITNESFIWVDESLGMPIKSETASTGVTSNNAKYTIELRDIKQDVDTKLFELPPNYRKVAIKDLHAEIRPSSSAQSSGKRNENSKAKSQ